MTEPVYPWPLQKDERHMQPFLRLKSSCCACQQDPHQPLPSRKGKTRKHMHTSRRWKRQGEVQPGVVTSILWLTNGIHRAACSHQTVLLNSITVIRNLLITARLMPYKIILKTSFQITDVSKPQTLTVPKTKAARCMSICSSYAHLLLGAKRAVELSALASRVRLKTME